MCEKVAGDVLLYQRKQIDRDGGKKGYSAT